MPPHAPEQRKFLINFLGLFKHLQPGSPFMNRRSRAFRGFFDAAIIATVSLASLLTAAYAALAARDTADAVAVIYAPWVGFDDAFRRSVGAGARFVRAGGLPFIVVVIPDDPEFDRRVRAGGAIMLADPVALAACFGVISPEYKS
jgi:hypothetical protein